MGCILYHFEPHFLTTAGISECGNMDGVPIQMSERLQNMGQGILTVYDKFDSLGALLETSFDKNATYQGRGMGIRKFSNEYKDMSKNNKTET